jgi:hypothetical protein
MVPDKVLYSDGHDVMVTDSELQVKNHHYKLNGITKCALMVRAPKRGVGIALILLGLGLLALGFLKAFSPGLFPDLQLENQAYSIDTAAMWVGGVLVVLGSIALAVVREKYSVRIATAEGEKDAVVSTKKEYVSQIVDAINNAVSYVRTKTGSRYFNMKGST